MNELIKIESFSVAELQVLQQQIVAKQMLDIQESMKDLNSRIDKSEEKQERGLAVAVNSMRVKQTQYGYITLKAFGNQFTVSIGSKTVGNLFRIVGIAQRNSETTQPYRQYIPRYSKTMANEHFSTFVWNYENCLNKIDDWLTDKGHYEEFYSITTEKEMKLFINELYSNI